MHLGKQHGQRNAGEASARSGIQDPGDVARMEKIVAWTRGKIRPGKASSLPNGILCLKGGDLADELAPFPRAKIYDISAFFCEEFFETKRVVYLPIS